MAIVATDIKFKFSTTAGSAGNSNSGTGAGSLGKYASTTELTSGSLHNLFDVVTGDENAASDIEYRCILVHNSHATLTYFGAVIWLNAEVAGGANHAISVDTTAASAVGSATAQAKQIASESVAPTSQTFSAPTTKAAGLALGDLAPGQVRAVWIRRTATNSLAVTADGATLRVEGDSNA